MKTVTCQECGVQVESERASRKFCDECRKAHKKAVTARTYPEWYKAKGIQYHKGWRDSHPEWRKQSNERSAKRQREIPGLKKRYDAAYYQRHKEQVKANAKAYAREQREKMLPFRRAALVRYRARLAKADGNFTAGQFRELCEAYDWHCAYCHLQTAELTVDHILPLSRGGSNDISNIIPACGPCNYSKRDKTPLEYVFLT